jgi:PEP-CTERM motif
MAKGDFRGFSMNSSHVLGAVAALILSAGLFDAAPAHADTVFDFTGTCDSGCTGTASGVLTLVDFFDDDNGTVNDSTFISFEYTSSSRTFLITRADGGSANGLLYDDGRAFGGLFISSSTGLPSFEASPQDFGMTPEEFAATTTPDPGTDDVGSSFRFVQVSGAIPEPSTWAMMLLGFAGLGYAGWRKVKQAAVARV